MKAKKRFQSSLEKEGHLLLNAQPYATKSRFLYTETLLRPANPPKRYMSKLPYVLLVCIISMMTCLSAAASANPLNHSLDRIVEHDSVTITIHVALVVNQRGATKAARILKTEVDPVTIDQIDEGLLEELTAEAIHDAKRYPGIAPKNKKMAQVVIPIAFVLDAREALKQ